ncbi:MAG TPA: hypothetical protein VF115_14960 [Acidimicrobiia bacterium]
MRGEEDLAELDSAQVATGDGCRSLSEWVAGSSRLGQRHREDAGACCASATGRPDLQGRLGDGEVSQPGTLVVLC